MDTWDDVGDTGLSKDTMPNGEYEVRIVKWKGKPYEKDDQKGRILDLTMELVAAPEGNPLADSVGTEWKDSWWLTRPDAKRIFFDELKAIGFDVGSWGSDEYPKGTMIPLAVKYCKLRGLTLKLKRTGTERNGRVYGNLKFVGRVGENGDEVTTIPNEDVLAVADEPEDPADIF